MRWLATWWWKVLLVGVGLFVLIQFVPFRVQARSARDEPKWDSPKTRALVMRACGDCHSNETKVLWFEQVAPIKWYIANHVNEGRSALNFSEWHTNAGGAANDATDAIGDGMPPAYYTYFGLHTDSKLTPAEVKALIAGLEKTMTADPPKGGGGN